MNFTPIVLIHVAAAGGALIAGGLTLAMRKGTTTHKRLGRAWIVLMLITALVSFGIKTTGHYSPIHLLSVISIASIIMSLLAAASGRIRAHRRGMTAAYAGLAIAGLVAMLPTRGLGRLMWQALGIA